MRAREITARRYAKALFLAARDAGSTRPVGEELDSFVRVVTADPEVHAVLARPWIKGEDRRAIAVSIAERNGAERLVRDFAGLVAERGRTDHLHEIATAYRGLLDEELGQARAAVRTAVPLTEQDRQRLGARLEEVVGRRVLIEEHVDRTLLGGFVAEVGSFVVDGSLDGQLARLRERLARG